MTNTTTTTSTTTTTTTTTTNDNNANITVIPIVIGAHGRVTKGLQQGLEDLEIKRNKRTSLDHLNYSIVEIGQNTEKSPEDLRRLAVTQTPVKDHQLTLK